MTPAERLAVYPDLLPTVGTITEIAAIVGIDRRTVSREVAPLIAILKLQGALPPCKCGGERFHPRNCTARRWSQPGVSRNQMSERGKAMIEMLADGMTFSEIAKIFGAPRGTVCSKLQYLTPEQRQRRTELGFHARRKGAAT